MRTPKTRVGYFVGERVEGIPSPLSASKKEIDQLVRKTAKILNQGLEPTGPVVSNGTLRKKGAKAPKGKIGFQGVLGAFSEEAVSLWIKESEPAACESFRELFEAVVSGRVAGGVLPLENSIAGAVIQGADLLWEFPEVEVVGEGYLQIRHCLLGLDEKIERVISHPQALEQCSSFLEKNKIRAIPFYDTAGAAKEIAQKKEGGLGAIASLVAAKRYGLKVLAEDISSFSDNRTRFGWIKKRGKGEVKVSSERTKLLLGLSAPHRPGGLAAILNICAAFSVNLTRLDSRPVPNQPFSYRFYIDGEVETAKAPSLLTALSEIATEVRVFGNFPVGSA